MELLKQEEHEELYEVVTSIPPPVAGA